MTSPAEEQVNALMERIEPHILLLICGEEVMLDDDLALLHEVETKVLVQTVKRNVERFPRDFMLQPTKEEFDDLKSQSVTSSRGGRRYPPYAFAEQGVAMLSSVLRSDRAIRVNVETMGAFVRLRQMLAALEKKCDAQFKVVFDAIRELMTPPERKAKCSIGFPTPEERK